MLRYTSNFIASAAALLLLYLLFLIFKPFATPLVFAGVVVVLFYPMHVWFAGRMPRFLASLASTLVVLVIIIIPALAIATGVVHETLDLAHTVGSLSMEKLMIHAHTQAARLGIDLDVMIQDVAQQIASQAGQLASQAIGDVWSVFIGLVVALLATFFFFRDGESALRIAAQALPLNRKWNETIINEIGMMIKSNIAASFAAASIQGIIGGLTFAWLNLPAPILWGTVMGFFSVFPFIGSWLIWAPTAIGLIIAGRIGDAIILIVIGIAIVNPVDNILRPAIVATATHLNGLLVLIGLLGGVQAFGVSGLLLGPVLVVVAATLLKAAQQHANVAKAK